MGDIPYKDICWEKVRIPHTISYVTVSVKICNMWCLLPKIQRLTIFLILSFLIHYI